MARQPRNVQVWAARVFPFLPGPPATDWVSVRALMAQTGLRERQVRHACAYIRDQYPQVGLVSGPRGYRFTRNRAEIEECRERLGSAAILLQRRLYSGVIYPTVRHRPARKTAAQQAWSTALGAMQAAIQAPLF